MIGRWTVINTFLGLIVLLLGVQITRTWMRSLPERAPVAEEPEDEERAGRRSGSSRPGAGREADPETIVAAIAAKDLFDPSRQPSGTGDVPTEDVPAEPPAPPGVTVVGVRMLGGDAEAMVADAAKGQEQRRVRVGDAIGDYTVEEIAETSIVLSAEGGEPVTLWLSLETGAAAAPAQRRATPASRPQATPPAAGRAQGANRRAAARAARAQRRRQQRREQRPPTAQLPDGVRERLEALRRNR